MVGTHGGQLGVRLGHESLQLFLEQLVCSLGGCGLDGRALGAALGGSILALETGILPAGRTLDDTLTFRSFYQNLLSYFSSCLL